MDTQLDQLDLFSDQSNTEFEDWLDEINALTPDQIEAERVYQLRVDEELERKMAEMEAF